MVGTDLLRFSCLVQIFPEHKEDLYRVINTDEYLQRFTDLDLRALRHLISIFPEHELELTNRFVNIGGNSERHVIP